MPFGRALCLLSLLCLGTETFGLTAQPVRLSLWKKAEAIAGLEFIALNEGVIDYLDTLERPTGGLKPFRYDCLAKVRAIQPTVQQVGGSGSSSSWVEILSIYELKDCVKIP